MPEGKPRHPRHLQSRRQPQPHAYQPDWHVGVIGILASRLKDKFHRPTVVFASSDGGELKGSGRSIPGLHLRDALDLVDKRHPGLIIKFGGHAMAAGLSLSAGRHAEFSAAFEAVVRELIDPADLKGRIETDGELEPAEHRYELQSNSPTQSGAGLPARVQPLSSHGAGVVGESSLKLKWRAQAEQFEADDFFHPPLRPERIRAVYARWPTHTMGQRRCS